MSRVSEAREAYEAAELDFLAAQDALSQAVEALGAAERAEQEPVGYLPDSEGQDKHV